MGLWSKITHIFSDAEPEVAPPAPTSNVAAGVKWPEPPAAPIPSVAAPAGEIPMDHASLDAMAKMSGDIARARMRAAGGVGFLTKDMIARIEQRKAEGLKMRQDRLDAESAAVRPTTARPAFPQAPTAPSQPQRPRAPMAPQQPDRMGGQGSMSMGSSQAGRYGSYRQDDGNLLFQMMYPELGVLSNPTSMQAWAVWMLSRDHSDMNYRGDGFRALIVDGGSTAQPTVQIVADDGSSIQAQCQLSEGRMTTGLNGGQTATFDFGADAPCDISYSSGDGRNFDWGVGTGISSSALPDDSWDLPASTATATSQDSSWDAGTSFDSGSSSSSWDAPAAPSSPADPIDFGNSPSPASSSWDSSPSPSPAASDDRMSTAY